MIFSGNGPIEIEGRESLPQEPQRLVQIRDFTRPVALVYDHLAGGAFARPRLWARERGWVFGAQLGDLRSMGGMRGSIGEVRSVGEGVDV